MSKKFVLIHGTWHGGWAWQEAHLYQTFSNLLPETTPFLTSWQDTTLG
jgi:hypothetical protein